MDIFITLRNKTGVLLIVFIILLRLDSYCQSYLVNFDENSKFCLVIFKQDYPLPFKVNAQSRYTPTLIELKNAEDLLMKSIDHLSDSQLKKCKRQYIGYIDSNGDKILTINLLRHLGKGKNRLYYGDWNKEFVLGFGDIYERNTFGRRINLTKMEISIGY